MRAKRSPRDPEAARALLLDGLPVAHPRFWYTDVLPGEELLPTFPGYLAELLAVPLDCVDEPYRPFFTVRVSAASPELGDLAFLRWRFWRPRRGGFIEQSTDGRGGW